MFFLYPFLITFALVFFSELGDKTQLLVLSFATKNKTKNILLGVALGTFFSHGFAILFGSQVACFSNEHFQFYLKFFSYASFLLFGIIGFLPKKAKSDEKNSEHFCKFSFLKSISFLHLHSIFLVAFCILVGELGDKTFLASLGLGFSYPNAKLPLILGSIAGMVTSNLIAIVCGKLMENHLKESFIDLLSNFIFLVFGLLGFAHLFWA